MCTLFTVNIWNCVVRFSECPTMQEMLQYENMVTSEGFITYQVPQEMTVYLRDRHCEHGWYHTVGSGHAC